MNKKVHFLLTIVLQKCTFKTKQKKSQKKKKKHIFKTKTKKKDILSYTILYNLQLGNTADCFPSDPN